MFKFLKKPPEIPEELDYLAGGDADAAPSSGSLPNFSDALPESEEITEGIAAKMEKKDAASRGKAVYVLLGVTLFVVVAAASYYLLYFMNAPIPAAIPKDDILASLASTPSAAPPGAGFSPAQAPAPQKPEPKQSQPPKATATSENKSAAPAAPAPSPQQAQTQQAAGQPEKKQEPAHDALSGVFGSNPFVDLSSLRSLVTASAGTGKLPHIGASGNMSLPEIPPPAVSSDLLPAPGEIRTPPHPGGSGSAPTMGGLIRSAGGNTVAIMGDGTVLSEGDTYKGDRRVTFIGGEGITFDDGNTIAFGGQQK